MRGRRRRKTAPSHNASPTRTQCLIITHSSRQRSLFYVNKILLLLSSLKIIVRKKYAIKAWTRIVLPQHPPTPRKAMQTAIPNSLLLKKLKIHRLNRLLLENVTNFNSMNTIEHVFKSAVRYKLHTETMVQLLVLCQT